MYKLHNQKNCFNLVEIVHSEADEHLDRKLNNDEVMEIIYIMTDSHLFLSNILDAMEQYAQKKGIEFD